MTLKTFALLVGAGICLNMAPQIERADAPLTAQTPIVVPGGMS